MNQFKCLLFVSIFAAASCFEVYFLNKLCDQTISMTTSLEWRLMVNRSEVVGAGQLNCNLFIETGPGRTMNVTLLLLNQVQNDYRYASMWVRDGARDSAFLTGGQRQFDNYNRPFGPYYHKTYDSILYIGYSDNRYASTAYFSLQVESLPAGAFGTGFMDNHCNGTIDMAAIGTESFYLKGTSRSGTYRSDQDCPLVFRSKPSEALRVELVNTSIEQCEACNCDWLEIRDGGNPDSQYIPGVDNKKICGMQAQSINVTRMYTTVQNALFLRFVSDHGDQYGGFEMKISRVLNEKAIRNAITVKCQDASWNIQLDLDRLGRMFPGLRTSDIYLGENSCTPTLVEGKYTFQNGFDECLTSRTVRNSVNVYSNEIINVERNPQFTFLIKRYIWRLQVECDIGANGTALGGNMIQVDELRTKPWSHMEQFVTGELLGNVMNDFKPVRHILYRKGTEPRHRTNVNMTLGGPGGFKNEVDLSKLASSGNAGISVNMSFYTDPNFATQVFGNPLKSSPGAHIYLKVFVPNIDFDKKILLKTCYIEPTLNAAENMKYYLIKNGCEVDTNTHFIAQEDHETRLVFDYFEYAGNSQGVYVVCNAITCGTTETTQNCIQTCNPVRKRSVFVPDMLNRR